MSAAVQVTRHEVRFERNTVTGLWRGKCDACGWFMVGEQQEVQSRATTHDLEWVPVEPNDKQQGGQDGAQESK